MTTSDPSQGAPPQPGADDDSPSSSQQPAADAATASPPAPAADPPADPSPSTPAPDPSTAPDGAPADPTPATSDDPQPSPTAADSTKDDSGDCAQIPTAVHAVLQADIRLQVRIPRTVDQAKLMSHKLTLTSDDGSVSQTLPISGAAAGDIDGTSMITFTGLAEHHTYALQIDNGDTNYIVFTNQAYEQIGEDDDGSSDSPPAASDGSGGSGDTGNAATT